MSSCLGGITLPWKLYIHAKDSDSVKTARFGSAVGNFPYNQVLSVESKCSDIPELNQILSFSTIFCFCLF